MAAELRPWSLPMAAVHTMYLRDLGQLTGDAAEAAKRECAAVSGIDQPFQQGQLMAYHEVLSLMPEQAVAFDIRRSLARRPRPDRDLV